MTKTGWYKGSQKPVRIGVYQRKYIQVVYCCYWDGLMWCHPTIRTFKVFEQALPWRGLTEEVK